MTTLDYSLFHQSLDRYFCLPTLEVEDTKEQLHSEGLLTSYLDFYQIFSWLEKKQIETFTDMGAGLGRSALIAKTWFPQMRVLGIELDPSRVETANKIGVELIESSIEDYYQRADAEMTQSYYLYFPWGSSLFAWLRMIKERPSTIVVVTESYGDFITLLEVHAPWLKRVDQLKAYSDRHDPYIMFYEVQATKEDGQAQLDVSRPVTVESLAPLYLLMQDFHLSFTYQSEKMFLLLSETELAYYPDKGFTLERLKPRRLYWWHEIRDFQILPISQL